MRVLIPSKDPWDLQNSFGNTFQNLFKGMRNIEVYNVCFKAGPLTSGFLKGAVQMTDGAVIHSIVKRNDDPCSEMTFQASRNPSEKGVETKVRRNTFTYFARDVIWRLGPWEKSPVLNAFLEEAKPDIIYLPIYSSWYLCDIQLYLIKKLGAPVAGHITDDVWGDLSVVRSPLKRLYTRVLRHKLKKLIAKCSYIEVFAENMQREYEKRFHKKCYLIGKGIDFEKRPLEEISIAETGNKKEITFLYTGNIGADRYRSLCMLAEELDRRQKERPAVLKIYSATQLDKKMRREFVKYKSLQFLGKVPFAKVQEEQSKADYLVFVEGFSKSSIAAVRMSFSTKIVDYMMARKPIFAIGPNEVYPIELLKNNDLAVVSTSPEELGENVAKALEGRIDAAHYVNRSIAYLREKRDIKVIQEGMRSRMAALINEGKQE